MVKDLSLGTTHRGKILEGNGLGTAKWKQIWLELPDVASDSFCAGATKIAGWQVDARDYLRTSLLHRVCCFLAGGATQWRYDKTRCRHNSIIAPWLLSYGVPKSPKSQIDLSLLLMPCLLAIDYWRSSVGVPWPKHSIFPHASSFWEGPSWWSGRGCRVQRPWCKFCHDRAHFLQGKDSLKFHELSNMPRFLVAAHMLLNRCEQPMNWIQLLGHVFSW